MRLDGRGGRALELSIVGYQFPGFALRLPGFDHDANWLVVQGHANDGKRGWTFRDPCLLTTEAAELVAWLEAIVDGRAVIDPTNFTEPNLEFSLVSADPPVVRVTFRLESKPPWAAEVTDDDWDGTWLDFETSTEALAIAAANLKMDVERYPTRRNT
jgi:hypothetical protein